VGGEGVEDGKGRGQMEGEERKEGRKGGKERGKKGTEEKKRGRKGGRKNVCSFQVHMNTYHERPYSGTENKPKDLYVMKSK
jgi:hypothetical protein